jgi:hypothetical protein
MGRLDVFKDRLIQKFGTRKDSYERSENAVAVETIEQHHYQKNLQEVVVQEHHEVELRHVLQPIVEEEVAPTQYHNKSRAPEFSEIKHEYDEVELERRQTQEGALSNIGSHVVAEDTSETVTLEPVVQQRVFKHVIEQVQPVLKRKVYYPHVVTEVVPRFEKHVHFKGVLDVQELKPLTLAEWKKRNEVLD